MTKKALKKIAAKTNQPQSETFRTFPQGIKKQVNIIPKNLHQETYLEMLQDDNKLIVISSGPAGCGKTYLSMLAGIKALSEKRVNKLILTRPAVSVDGEEKIGALPGDLNEKMDPYMRPLLDVLFEYYSGKEIENMIENKVIEIIPISFMRGRNFKKAWVIFDESQNAGISQIKAVLTRICDGSKVIVTGDIKQSDRKDSDNGLLCFLKMLNDYNKSKYISCIEFEHKDIERHPVVAENI